MKKQPAHGCMPADRIICRTWEHTNRALIFQSVPGCPKCPTVPAFRGRDSGRKPNIKKSHEQLFITEI